MAAAGIATGRDGRRRSAYELLAGADIDFEIIEALDSELPEWDEATRKLVKIDATYAQYEERQQREAVALKRDETVGLARDMDYAALSGLSKELQGKLAAIRPESIAAASRIEGMTPAALSLLIASTRRAGRA